MLKIIVCHELTISSRGDKAKYGMEITIFLIQSINFLPLGKLCKLIYNGNVSIIGEICIFPILIRTWYLQVTMFNTQLERAR
jgi:hypothetical protein